MPKIVDCFLTLAPFSSLHTLADFRHFRFVLFYLVNSVKKYKFLYNKLIPELSLEMRKKTSIPLVF